MLQTLRLGHLRKPLAQFWPARGPTWDALAICEPASGKPGVLLAEGKSYPREMYSSGTQAGKAGSERSRRSRRQIESAVLWAQRYLGIPNPDVTRWLDPPTPGRTSSSLFQTANRLTFGAWFNAQGVDCWFCHLLFTNDPTHSPTTKDRWTVALSQAEQQLGIDCLDIEFAGHAFLDGLHPPRELLLQ